MFGSFASVKDKEKAWRVYMWEIRVPFAVNMVLAAAVLAAVLLPRKVASHTSYSSLGKNDIVFNA